MVFRCLSVSHPICFWGHTTEVLVSYAMTLCLVAFSLPSKTPTVLGIHTDLKPDEQRPQNVKDILRAMTDIITTGNARWAGFELTFYQLLSERLT